MNANPMRMYRQRVRDDLHNNIIPFWLTHAADRQHGGFIGWMTMRWRWIRKAIRG
jgi:mannose/cellobiose epimerase-like protein (N-acyl-D-glucosamine 2-epimerase family)